MELAGKEYQAACFGRQAITWNGDFASREFWRLENAYDDFKNCPKTGDVLPYDNYPMNLEAGEVFVIDYTKTDGSVVRRYYRSDGRLWGGQACDRGIHGGIGSRSKRARPRAAESRPGPCSFAGQGTLCAASRARSCSLTGSPPAKPVRDPVEPTTRWQGKRMARG